MNIKKAILAVVAILAAEFSAQATVLVSNINAGTVGLYDDVTGATINDSFITGLSGPYGITHDSTSIFVANSSSGVISQYDVATGAAISPSFISGLTNPTGIQAYNGILYVANAAGPISTYDAATGTQIQSSLLSVGGIRFFEIYNNQIYVPDFANDVIGIYGLDGSAIDADFVSLYDPSGLAFVGNRMFATSSNQGWVVEYDLTTGLGNLLITSGLSNPVGIATNSDGNLLVADLFGPVSLYDTDGTLLGETFLEGTDWPIGLDVIPVPEPSAVSLFAASGVGLAFLRKRRSRK
jgi:hypothetical protein